MMRRHGVRRNGISPLDFIFRPVRVTVAALSIVAPLVAEMGRTQRYDLMADPVANLP
ncbi:hypothetical protein DF3PA_200013 [Candidatus Defluviicoccus seviourii]|uniref:Uncharacterized protein n=1 Tax=Candidatus Defluviicoccus seviourii TaxID=2565273 RepID=A0A564WDE7_9PROT|nr:hypothetical protein DF3PA_200013 [Candidatus Defluviicoccus seviourii]